MWLTFDAADTDVLVVGGGAAACMAAISAHAAEAKMLVIDKGQLGKSGCSPDAHGGMAIYHKDPRDDHGVSGLVAWNIAEGSFLHIQYHPTSERIASPLTSASTVANVLGMAGVWAYSLRMAGLPRIPGLRARACRGRILPLSLLEDSIPN